MIDVDRMLLEINIRNRQTTKFRDAKTCFKRYVDSLIIPANEDLPSQIVETYVPLLCLLPLLSHCHSQPLPLAETEMNFS